MHWDAVRAIQREIVQTGSFVTAAPRLTVRGRDNKIGTFDKEDISSVVSRPEKDEYTGHLYQRQLDVIHTLPKGGYSVRGSMLEGAWTIERNGAFVDIMDTEMCANEFLSIVNAVD
jgi:hypothetical protein